MATLGKLISITTKSDNTPNRKKHPKCLGEYTCGPEFTEFECGYSSVLMCEECKYGLGRKDPEAKCNQEGF